MRKTGRFLFCITALLFSFFIISCDDSGSGKKSTPANIDPNAVFVSTTGNDSNSGTMNEPKLTIQAGVSAAIAGPTKKVYVAAGTYEESVDLTDGVSLYGGCSATDWYDRNINDRTNPAYQTVIQGPASEYEGINISGTFTGDWIVEGFTISSGHPDNSYGVNITADATTTIRYNTINGGIGDNESNGIYVHQPNAKSIINNNIINGGSSTGASSNGIYIETAADQIITDNVIDGGSGSNDSVGITMTFPLASTSLIARNTINGGSSSNLTYAIAIYNYYAATSAPIIHANDIDAGTGSNCWGILCYGNGDGQSVAPIICNNVIEAVSTYPRALYFQNVDGSPVVYNNTISTSSATDQANAISSTGSVDRASSPDIRNNIIIGDSTLCIAFYEENNSNSLFSYIMNNDIYGCSCTIITGGTAYFGLTDLNGLRPGISDNISVDPALDSDLVPTVSTPVSVAEGGLDLSGVTLFPENTGGDKIDKLGGDRTPGWTIGAYEID